MEVLLKYRGRSGLNESFLSERGFQRQTLSLAPNLARDPVAFDAPILQPLRFREAISALHDVVISDLRFEPKDHTAYEAWKKAEQLKSAALRREAFKNAQQEILARQANIPANLVEQYEDYRKKYWAARQKYSDYLLEHDKDLWRKLMPCDPVVTVADDVVFFECFSADESSYGCLSVNRGDGFGESQQLKFGTTNVDYSWDLYDHFQSLRNYRETRFSVDPEGIEVATHSPVATNYREEKIDLPAGWLRGFMQVQVAMGLPLRKVSLSREAVYNILAWHKRHKARKSPRALRFELQSGKPPVLMMEPWEQQVVSHTTRYDGPADGPIRIWGTRRLLSLARVLPLVDSFDVYLLGTGLPSFWIARMGEMRLTLGLSGWTTNDWTNASALDLLLPEAAPASGIVTRAADYLRKERSARFEQIRSAILCDAATCAAALNQLARTGQVIHDLDARVYRWRQIMPQVVGEQDLGAVNPEQYGAKHILGNHPFKIDTNEIREGKRYLRAVVREHPVELTLDMDGLIKEGKCSCSHHRSGGLRRGPCRHLLALRQAAMQETPGTAAQQDWYDALLKWANN
ncbi:metal-binding protein [Anatilimnocola sp. NA78]|uniref:metal-binding protein n=1 Tax=Anatilimnocola sp. NA78 TaxID=3415683 RepID=UPI003CE5B3C3